MYTTVQKYNDPQTAALRQEVGRWLKERREATGRSQREVANLVGVEFYTWVSQLETGRGRVPPDRYEAYARALDMDVRELVMKLFPYYDPVTAKILFPADGTESATDGGSQQQGGQCSVADAMMWHREACEAQNALTELERRSTQQLSLERSRADMAEAKLRDLESSIKEAAYAVTQPCGDAPEARCFFLGFMGLPIGAIGEKHRQLAHLGRVARETVRLAPDDFSNLEDITG